LVCEFYEPSKVDSIPVLEDHVSGQADCRLSFLSLSK